MVASRVRIAVTAVFLVGLCWTARASAATITAASCQLPAVQAAVNSANNGDTVNIPAGSCTWTSAVAWENKKISLIGAGIGQTVITGDFARMFAIYITNAAAGAFRVSGMTLAGTSNLTNEVFLIYSGGLAAIPSGRWRIDHIHFNYPAGQREGVHVQGVNYGVFDHNTIDWHSGLFMYVQSAMANECGGGGPDLSGAFALQSQLDLGTDKFVFMEDNHFIPHRFDNPLWVFDSTGGGARLVYRHNSGDATQIYNHWTRGCEMAGLVFEIYNNSFTNGGYDQQYPVRLEAGTGVMFSNYSNANGGAPFVYLDDRRAARTSGATAGSPLGECDGTHPFEGNADAAAPGWPCLGQIGRNPYVDKAGFSDTWAALKAGKRQGSAPFYMWNNGTQPTCATGGACTNVIAAWAVPATHIKKTPHPNGEVDYVEGAPMPGYTPYVYPHPLVSGSAAESGGSTSAPAPPTNVRVVGGL